MEYRDQLKYIKSHKIAEDSDQKKKEEPYDERYDDDAYDELDETSIYDVYDLGLEKEYHKDRKQAQPRQEKPSTKNKGKKQTPPKKKRKTQARSGRILFGILLVSALLFIGALVYVGIFPWLYIAVALVVALLLVLLSNRGRRRVLSILCIAVFLLLGLFLLRIDRAIGEVAHGDSTLDVGRASCQIYISGMDTYGEITEESRSDVNLIVTVNPIDQRMLLTTTPRDYYVVIPGVTGGEYDKLTHAGIYGVEASMAALENLYGVEIPFYVRVNFTSLIEMVDLMGGVTVDSEVAFTTSKAAGEVVEIQAGENHLNGAQALAFARERKAFTTGDNQRGKNQQALLTGMLKSALTPMTILRSGSIISSLTSNIQTNLSKRQVKTLIRQQLDPFADWETESVAATGDDSAQRVCYSYPSAPLYVMIPDTASVAQISEKMRAYLQ